MRNILLLLICSVLIAGGIVSNAQINQQQDNAVVPQDSTIDVIGYFSKNDTLVYWINQSNWKFSSSDTIKTGGVSAKVRLTVVDSTSTGYKMDYTFLEFLSDSVANSGLDGFQNAVTEKLSKKIVGTTISFETDEYGTITKFNNFGQIKRQAKSLFNDAMKELAQMPEIVRMKNEFNIDIKDVIKNVDSDKIVDDYLEELKLLFIFHGRSYNTGESYIHEDATEATYETDTYITAELDSSDYTYSIEMDAIRIIPLSVVKSMVGELVEMMDNDAVKESFDNDFDTQVKDDAILRTYFRSDYIAYGWPYRVVQQTTQSIKGQGKLMQTYIYLDYISD